MHWKHLQHDSGRRNVSTSNYAIIIAKTGKQSDVPFTIEDFVYGTILNFESVALSPLRDGFFQLFFSIFQI